VDKSMKIYIAGPYSAKTKRKRLQNAIRAVKAGLILFKKGHYPFIPHLFHWADQYARIMGLEMTWEDWMKWDIEWLVECDAILFLGSSPGANIELNIAKELNLKIYYSTDEVPEVCRG
jgi:hypothetical protein